METKIKINNVHLKYSWKWKVEEETCLICQQEFNNACHKCTHPIQCTPCIGICLHTFHLHCVEEWLQNNKNCPMCRCSWEYKKIMKFDSDTKM